MFDPYEEVNTYFNFHQRMVILSLLNVAKSQKSKTIEGFKVYNYYINLCDKYNIEKVFENRLMLALKVFEVAGFIKIKEGMKITKLDLEPYTVDDWIKAILQDPEFSKVKEGK